MRCHFSSRVQAYVLPGLCEVKRYAVILFARHLSSLLLRLLFSSSALSLLVISSEGDDLRGPYGFLLIHVKNMYIFDAL